MQGELAYEEDITACLFYRAIHDAGTVIEDAQIDDLPAQPSDVFRRIGVLDAYEYEQTAFNC